MACRHRRLEKGFIFILYWCQGFCLAGTSIPKRRKKKSRFRAGGLGKMSELYHLPIMAL